MMDKTAAEAISLDGPAFLEVWQCSVVVINFVNYPEAVVEVPDRELVLWQHCMYCKLDAIVKKHQADKVSTSQELYTAVLGEIDEANTAEAAVKLATELLETVKKMKLPSGAPLNCRIAVSSGKVAAAVTGTSAWAFQLYGKTLEKAKAVVQAGPHGVLQLTEDVMDHLAAPDASMYKCHRMQPEFGGMSVYVQTLGGDEGESFLIVAKELGQISCQVVAAALKLATIPLMWAHRAIHRSQFLDARMEEQFCAVWNAKLYHTDLWALSALLPLSLVVCLSVPSSPQATAWNTASLWLLMLLSATLALLWSYHPHLYIRHRTALLSSYRAARAFLFFLCRWRLAVEPTHMHLPLLVRACIPNSWLISSILAVGMQLPLAEQLTLQAFTCLMMLLQHWAACRQTQAGSLWACLASCLPISSGLSFITASMLCIALSHTLEQSARMSFMRGYRKRGSSKKAD